MCCLPNIGFQRWMLEQHICRALDQRLTGDNLGMLSSCLLRVDDCREQATDCQYGQAELHFMVVTILPKIPAEAGRTMNFRTVVTRLWMRGSRNDGDPQTGGRRHSRPPDSAGPCQSMAQPAANQNIFRLPFAQDRTSALGRRGT